jgi:hypothetical protein
MPQIKGEEEIGHQGKFYFILRNQQETKNLEGYNRLTELSSDIK